MPQAKDLLPVTWHRSFSIEFVIPGVPFLDLFRTLHMVISCIAAGLTRRIQPEVCI
jgi:hypothetical protein